MSELGGAPAQNGLDWSFAKFSRIGQLPVVQVRRKRAREPVDVVLIEEQQPPPRQRRRLDGAIEDVSASLQQAHVSRSQVEGAAPKKEGNGCAVDKSSASRVPKSASSGGKPRRVVLRRVASRRKTAPTQTVEQDVQHRATRLHDEAQKISSKIREQAQQAQRRAGSSEQPVLGSVLPAIPSSSQAGRRQATLMERIQQYGAMASSLSGRSSHSGAHGLLPASAVGEYQETGDTRMPKPVSMGDYVSKMFETGRFSELRAWLSPPAASASRSAEQRRRRCQIAQFAHSTTGKTFLMAAAKHNLQQLCEQLLKYGASTVAQSSERMTASEYARRAGHFKLEAFLESHAEKQEQSVDTAPYTGTQAGVGVLASAAGPTTASEQLTSAAGGVSSNVSGSIATSAGVARSIIPGAALSRSSRRLDQAHGASAAMRKGGGAGSGLGPQRLARGGARALEEDDGVGDGDDDDNDDDDDEDEEEDYYVVDPLGTMMASMPPSWAAQLGGGKQQQMQLGASDRQRDDWHASAEGAAGGVRLALRTHSPPLQSVVSSSAPNSPVGSVGSRGSAGRLDAQAAPSTRNRWKKTQTAGGLYGGAGSRRMDGDRTVGAGSSGRSSRSNPHGYELDPDAFGELQEEEHLGVDSAAIRSPAPRLKRTNAWQVVSRSTSVNSVSSTSRAHTSGHYVETHSAAAQESSIFESGNSVVAGLDAHVVGGEKSSPIDSRAFPGNVFMQAAFGNVVPVTALPDDGGFVEVGDYAYGAGALDWLGGARIGSDEEEGEEDGSDDSEAEGQDYPDNPDGEGSGEDSGEESGEDSGEEQDMCWGVEQGGTGAAMLFGDASGFGFGRQSWKQQAATHGGSEMEDGDSDRSSDGEDGSDGESEFVSESEGEGELGSGAGSEDDDIGEDGFDRLAMHERKGSGSSGQLTASDWGGSRELAASPSAEMDTDELPFSTGRIDMGSFSSVPSSGPSTIALATDPDGVARPKPRRIKRKRSGKRGASRGYLNPGSSLLHQPTLRAADLDDFSREVHAQARRVRVSGDPLFRRASGGSDWASTSQSDTSSDRIASQGSGYSLASGQSQAVRRRGGDDAAASRDRGGEGHFWEQDSSQVGGTGPSWAAPAAGQPRTASASSSSSSQSLPMSEQPLSLSWAGSGAAAAATRGDISTEEALHRIGFSS